MHSIEPLPQRRLVENVVEHLVAVDDDHRNALAIRPVELRIERDVDHLELEVAARQEPVQRGAGVLAEVTARLAIESDSGHRCHSRAVEHLELVIFGLLVGIVAFASLASLLRIPYPISLVLGGLVMGFIPGVPSPELDPELVLLIFLPPLLYGAAFFTSLRDLRRNARPIALLSIVLVFVTMGAVALVAHEVIGLSWGVSFVLGAIVSPTDAVAPAEILRRIGAPRQMLTVVEGENLTNDWTALVLYKVAVAAVVSGTFSLFDATVEFLLSGIGGLAVGLVAGRIIREVRRRINDPPTEITISILSGYAAYLPAEELGFSGVIAAVTVGIYMGWHTPELTTPIMRMQGVSVWEILIFLLNAVLFLLIGMQMPSILDDLGGDSAGDLVWWALLISVTVIAVRMLWQFTAVYVIRAIDRREVQRMRRSTWQRASRSAGPACAARCHSPRRSRCRSRPTAAHPSPSAI